MRIFIPLTFLIACLFPLSISRAGEDTTQQLSRDEERLSQRIKGEILRDLQKEDWLAQQIEQGIERYIERLKKQAEAERVAQERQANEKAKQVRAVSATRDHIRGNPDAEISLIEYSDFECPFCKQFHATAKQLVEESAGKVNWVYRHFPLAVHNPGAQQEAEAAECAGELGGEETFWAYADAIYARTTSNSNGFSKEKFTPLAEELGLDKRAFQECLDSGRHTSRTKEDVTDGESIGVTGTPGNIMLHNRTGAARIVLGAISLLQLQSTAELLMKENGENAGTLSQSLQRPTERTANGKTTN